MPKHTNEELINLIRNSTGEDQGNYLAILYNQNYGMIHKICKNYSAYECIEDLEQEGFFGLRIAVDRYDPEKGVLFLSYASFWIRQAVRRYLDECGSVLRLPVHLRDQIIQYEQITKKHQREYGRNPTNEELMQALSVDRKKLQQIKNYSVLIRPASLDKVISAEDDSFSLGDMIADPGDQYQDLDDLMDAETKKRMLWDEVDQLGEKQAEVIRKRFQQDLSIKEIAESNGVTEWNVRGIQERALRKLKRSSKIRLYAEEYISAKAYSGTGLSAFRSSGTSATERTALDLYERSLENYCRQLDREISRIERKLHIELGDDYRRMKIEEYKARQSS